MGLEQMQRLGLVQEVVWCLGPQVRGVVIVTGMSGTWETGWQALGWTLGGLELGLSRADAGPEGVGVEVEAAAGAGAEAAGGATGAGVEPKGAGVEAGTGAEAGATEVVAVVGAEAEATGAV